MEKTAGLRVHYDKEVDVLYLSREGKEASVEEAYPGISLEFNEEGNIVGIEILNASLVLKDTIESPREKIA